MFSSVPSHIVLSSLQLLSAVYKEKHLKELVSFLLEKNQLHIPKKDFCYVLLRHGQSFGEFSLVAFGFLPLCILPIISSNPITLDYLNGLRAVDFD